MKFPASAGMYLTVKETQSHNAINTLFTWLKSDNLEELLVADITLPKEYIGCSTSHAGLNKNKK